jgi:hypothetical protein
MGHDNNFWVKSLFYVIFDKREILVACINKI